MSRHRSDVLHWFNAGRVLPGREQDVLRAAEEMPSRSDWRGFVELLTLWLGTLALAAAVIFFFAFNWDDLHRLAKLALVEAAILGALAACWRVGLDTPPGKAVLVLLSLLVGALLALTGQIYQTGADTYELFAWWAVLILPWVLVSRFSPLWVVWLGIVNLAVFLYHQRGLDGEELMWALFGLNSLALVGWEAAHRRGSSWLQDSWPPRLIAIASGTWATLLIVWAIVDEWSGAGGFLPVLAYLAWLAAFYHWYRNVRPDLFMLAGGLLSLIVTITVLLSKHLLGGDATGSFLFIGLVVIAMSAGGAIWLKSVQRELRT